MFALYFRECQVAGFRPALRQLSAVKVRAFRPETVEAYASVVRYPIPTQEASKVLVTPLRLRVSMGSDDHLLSCDSQDHLLLENAIKETYGRARPRPRRPAAARHRLRGRSNRLLKRLAPGALARAPSARRGV
ncbi:hypothetical protein EVAR_58483_1 [Eumeta japonica]|uniref:Uncharacterized protein n=1 Tax=Eumeta variegata TaxID=151549 RepID=A0A4C1YQ67_EUMVA|nr:hypothetical protein EVAR_58483_1 [Eumeta japonica]